MSSLPRAVRTFKITRRYLFCGRPKVVRAVWTCTVVWIHRTRPNSAVEPQAGICTTKTASGNCGAITAGGAAIQELPRHRRPIPRHPERVRHPENLDAHPGPPEPAPHRHRCPAAFSLRIRAIRGETGRNLLPDLCQGQPRLRQAPPAGYLWTEQLHRHSKHCSSPQRQARSHLPSFPHPIPQ